MTDEHTPSTHDTTESDDIDQQIPTTPSFLDLPYHVQVTVIQQDNYGPWTVRGGEAPRPEMDLQKHQAELYRQAISHTKSFGGYVFNLRGDHLHAITNQMGVEELKTLQASINNQSPTTVSVATTSARVPTDASLRATEILQRAGSAQDDDRTNVFEGDCAPENSQLQVAHFDIVDVTGTLTDTMDCYSATLQIREWVSALQHINWQRYGGLTYFVGGDNAIGVFGQMAKRDYRDILNTVDDVTDHTTQVGIGTGQTAEEAGMNAKHALERAREENRQLVAPQLATKRAGLGRER